MSQFSFCHVPINFMFYIIWVLNIIGAKRNVFLQFVARYNRMYSSPEYCYSGLPTVILFS